jgi:sugar lactone lactonase YvrE
MRIRWLSLTVFLIATSGWVSAWADPPKFPQNATFTTLITTSRAIEGLTGDGVNNLYVGGSGPPPCPIWQINLHSPSLKVVGNITPASGNCTFAGIAFDAAGNLYQTDLAAGIIYTLKPNAVTPPAATVFATGVPGTNGLAFDKAGNLWTGDGTTGRGRFWKITGSGANCTGPAPIINCVEVFRIQPMSNEVNLDASGVGGVGRDVRDLPPGTITVTPTSRNAANTLGSQPLVANGIAFDHDGETMFIIDTARGALWKVDLKHAEFNSDGTLAIGTGCDTTFTSNTLCLSNIFVAHPILEGGDGIALDREGNIWVDANERNAVAVVTKKGEVFEVFRNPVNLPLPPPPVPFLTGLRNAGDQSVGNNHILEFPTSPFLTGKVFCTSQSDLDRRDNSPRAAGEVNSGLPVDGVNQLGKISCMDQELNIPGLPLPVTSKKGRR